MIFQCHRSDSNNGRGAPVLMFNYECQLEKIVDSALSHTSWLLIQYEFVYVVIVFQHTYIF